MKRAATAATRIQRRVAGGATLAAAVAAEQVRLPGVTPLNLSRREIEQQQRVTRPTILFFSMAKGTTKALEVPEAGAWYVINLADVQTENVPANNPRVEAQRAQLRQLLPDEYTQQFIAAMRREVDVEIDNDAVTALTQLLGGAGGN